MLHPLSSLKGQTLPLKYSFDKVSIIPFRDVARHGLGGLKPPKQKYSPPNEMKEAY